MHSDHPLPHPRHAPQWRVVIVVALGCLLLGACASDGVLDDLPPAEVGGRLAIGGLTFGGGEERFGFTGDYSGDEEALRARARRFDRTVWQGALLGAVAGTAIGALAGGDAESAAAGALVGAAAGAVAGVYVANLRERYVEQEDQLDAMIADVERSNREAEALIASIETVLAEDRRRLAAVRTRLARQEATAADLQQARGRAWSNRAVVEQAALGGRDQYRVFQAAANRIEQQRPGPPPAALNQALQGYRANLDTLDRLVREMERA